MGRCCRRACRGAVSALSLLLPLLLIPLLFLSPSSIDSPSSAAPRIKRQAPHLPLRFRYDGSFKILQVADMHFGNGMVTRCRDVPSADVARCSDLNTTRFLTRMIQAEDPDLVVFTGDNIFGSSATDAAESLFRAFRPVMESGLPWAAVLGNHDQESTMTREELMSFISLMDYSVSQLNPPSSAMTRIDGFGNYVVTVKGFRTYGWIRESQLAWLRNTSQLLQAIFQAPAMAFFHIPVPEVRDLWFKEFSGQYQEAVACSSVNSGALKSLVSMGDVKAVFLGHDHLNDFCGEIDGIWFCYGGGFGYHGYGRAGWPRRARVISASLRRGKNEWLGVEAVRTWKRLDSGKLSKIDCQVLWSSEA